MPRSEESEAFYSDVCELVQLIPRGKVTTYGHIAQLLGKPRNSRQVGNFMKTLPSADSGHHFTSANVPWQRVINSAWCISPRAPGSAERQAEALRAEGVEVMQNSMGTFHVAHQWLWLPNELPLEFDALPPEFAED